MSDTDTATGIVATVAPQPLIAGLRRISLDAPRGHWREDADDAADWMEAAAVTIAQLELAAERRRLADQRASMSIAELAEASA